MKILLVCMFVVGLSQVARSQTGFSGHKKIWVGGTSFDVHNPGLSFGTANPIFLVPTDTTGNLIFTGIIRGVRAMGRFTPYSYGADSTYAVDPLTGHMALTYDSVYHLQKHGEWNYYYDDGLNYREYFDKGTLIRKDSAKYFFTDDKKGITLGDSTARIRSIIDLYIKKGDSPNH